jgi:hypothetical protein
MFLEQLETMETGRENDNSIPINIIAISHLKDLLVSFKPSRGNVSDMIRYSSRGEEYEKLYSGVRAHEEIDSAIVNVVGALGKDGYHSNRAHKILLKLANELGRNYEHHHGVIYLRSYIARHCRDENGKSNNTNTSENKQSS